ncbi:MAG: oligosaccharide flippase family protein [Rhizobiaceae bacterium]|nr:oligosaccharide flippase family protein [Rhizobiaceae bacterium]
MKSLLKQVERIGPFVRNVATLAGGTAVAQLVGLAATPVLSRLYTPAEFGILAAFLSIAGVIVAISSLVYEFAIPLPYRNDDARKLLATTLAMNAATALLCACLAFSPLGPYLASQAGMEALLPYLWLLPLTVLFAGTYKISGFWAVRHKHFMRIATTKVVQILSMIAIQLAGGWIMGTALWLIVGYIANQSMGSLSLLGGRAGLKSILNTRIWTGRTRALLRKHSWFPKYDGPATLIDVFSATLPALLFLPLFGPAVAGSYFLAERVVATPLAYLSLSIGQVLYGDVRQLSTEGRLVPTLRKITMIQAAITALPALVVVVAGSSLFTFVFGENWREAGLYAMWLTPAFYVNSLYPAIAPVLSATRGQRKRLIIHTAKLVLGALAIAFGYVTGEAIWAIIALSLSYTLVYGTTVAWIYVHAARHDRGIRISSSSINAT